MTKTEIKQFKESNKSEVQKTHPIQKKQIKSNSNRTETLDEIRCEIMAQIKKIFSRNKTLQSSQIKLIQDSIENCFEYTKMQDYNIVLVTDKQVDSKKTQIKKILLKKVNQNYRILKIPLKTQLAGLQVIQQQILKQVLHIKGKKSFSTLQIIRQLKQFSNKQKIIVYVQDIEKFLQKKVNIYTDSVFQIFSKSQNLNIMLFCVSNSFQEIKKHAEKFLNFDKIKNISLNSQNQQQILSIVNNKLTQIQSQTRAKIVVSQEMLIKLIKKCMHQQGRLIKVLQTLRDLIEKQLSNQMPLKHQKNIIKLEKYQTNNFQSQNEKKIEQLKNLPLFQKIIFFTLFLQINLKDDIFCQKSKIFLSAKPICNYFGAPYNYNFVNENLSILIDYGYVVKCDKKKNTTQSQRLRLSLSRKDAYKVFISHPIFSKLMSQYKIEQ